MTVVSTLSPGDAWFPALPVAALRVGDHWESDTDTVEVTSVGPVVEGEYPGVLLIQVKGRIIRGWGAGPRERTWEFNVNQKLTVHRPGTQ